LARPIRSLFVSASAGGGKPPGKGEKLTWTTIASFSPPLPKTPRAQDADWRRDVHFCFENTDFLSERELDFISNLARGGQEGD
jgi:hypothetical protein